MKITKTNSTDSKTSSVIDFEDDLNGLSKSEKSDLMSQIGELIIEEILSSVASAKSPIDGKNFEKLSKEYAALKLADTGSNKANLDLTGSMLGSLDYKVTNGKLEVGVFGDDAQKADGHNNFSGKSKLPERRFLPDESQLFDSDIMSLIDEKVGTFKADNMTLKPDILNEISSAADLYSYLSDVIGDYTNAELKSFVLSSEMSLELDDYDLLKYL